MAADWGDLEQAFFDAAPPDDPEPPAEAPRFDDLTSTVPTPGRTEAWVRRGLAELRRILDTGAQALDGQLAGVVFMALLVLVGLSAVVYASVR